MHNKSSTFYLHTKTTKKSKMAKIVTQVRVKYLNNKKTHRTNSLHSQVGNM